MSRQNWKGGALLAPVPPTLVTCKSGDRQNVITVAWCGILSTVPPKTYISLRPQRYSYGIIKESREFVINLPTAEMVKTVDFCGMYTGAKVDKIARTGMSLVHAEHVDAPIIENCPLALECRVCDIVPLGSHDMFIADILSVSVDDRLLNRDGKLETERANLLAYAHGDYFSLGKKLGCFGISSMKKNSQKKKNAALLKIRKSARESTNENKKNG